MNVLKMTDAELSNQISILQTEAKRRVAALKVDDAAIIRGCEAAKRALVVAATGNHSICFIGQPSCGKTMLRALALKLGVENSYEMRACPCGWLGSITTLCTCKLDQVKKHQRTKAVDAEIYIEVVPLENFDRETATPIKYYQEQIDCGKVQPVVTEIDSLATTLLKCAERELNFTIPMIENIQRIAGSIARLDREKMINSSHIAEAVMYRRPKGF